MSNEHNPVEIPSAETIATWRSQKNDGMVSAIGEYVPEEFWQLVDAVEFLVKERGDPTQAADYLEGREFYEVCQRYRHAQDITGNPSAAEAFEDLKKYIRFETIGIEVRLRAYKRRIVDMEAALASVGVKP